MIVFVIENDSIVGFRNEENDYKCQANEIKRKSYRW